MTASIAYCHGCKDLDICCVRRACVLEPGPSVTFSGRVSRKRRAMLRLVDALAISGLMAMIVTPLLLAGAI